MNEHRLTFSITGYYLHFIHLHQVSDLTELHVIQNKRPHIVTKSVGVQRALQIIQEEGTIFKSLVSNTWQNNSDNKMILNT